MSRVGKNPVSVPSGVEVKVADGTITTKGKLGQLSVPYVTNLVSVSVTDGSVDVKPANDSKESRSLWGTTRNLVRNMVVGVSEGWTKKLEITGVGYRAAVEGKDLVLSLGFSHPVRHPIPEGIKIVCPAPTQVEISGADKQLVGQVASEIRAYRGPEPYKGKGVRYADEVILRKEGKKK
ncbi:MULTISPECIES: 50S ribosomal protein L6 [Oceanibaculum]|uniref:Large ribosomal subunit protein uL6 n=2 Tax=Oceanibaculum indicum TaxID=526216 RepID=K2JT46_9PROT|nr:MULTISPECIES: 50S ribosomal protein L6 [Oceanibaculum]EKE73579.1 50S ribosomal protein L6 [Oceanibaculum indicum P24]MCH2394244.1 50S ribosomal protein L6 [Oceanibaculum sp.]RKQ73948.1 large subunit ribosomal protein L6 [Oceanibaculum indicum]